jgi:hypothetical protein
MSILPKGLSISDDTSFSAASEHFKMTLNPDQSRKAYSMIDRADLGLETEIGQILETPFLERNMSRPRSEEILWQ